MKLGDKNMKLEENNNINPQSEENKPTKKRKKFKEKSKGAKIAIVTGISLSSILLLALLGAGGYVGYVSAQFYRIEDKLDLTNDIIKGTGTIKNASNIDKNTELSILTYNVGFGAYDHDYSFFMDVGTMKDGTVITGKYAKAIDKDHATKNTAGSVKKIKEENTDFVFLQEVDKESDRCYHINQYDEFNNALTSYSSVYASNFHTAYLAYPFNDPIGKTEAGIVTYSKYGLTSSLRRSYPVDLSFPTKFFDLDRCFSVSRITLSSGKNLVLANSHMSAYDEGGKIRRQQLEMLTSFMSEEYAKGNYVIVGGDFNHDLCSSADQFESDELHPDWVAEILPTDIPEHFSIISGMYGQDNVTKVPTCRAAEMPYTKKTNSKGKEYLSNYTVVIDGFICSNNITVTDYYNIDWDFEFSDHNPARMSFTLNM
jgi:endonuclease/exonuclease/phosphatase family metal-dependent hydrolase